MSGSKHFEVVYIDKFSDSYKAQLARDNLRAVFGLSTQQLDKLACGDPIVIKKEVSLSEASRYRSAVIDAGGIAWVQELDENGNHVERRQEKRRQLADRRNYFRASSIQPDRRQNCGRRSTDDPIRIKH